MPKQRIQYFDAIRGLAMLFVVMGHISLFSFHKSGCGLLGVVTSLEIPLFFLISGYFTYKPSSFWTFSNISSSIQRKFMALIVPAIIFVMAYTFLQGGVSVENIMYDPYKYGYWFTISLFEFFLISIPVLKVVSRSNWLIDSVLAWGGVILVFVGVYLIRIQDTNRLIGLFGLQHLTDYIYFLLGILWHKYSDRFNNALRNNLLITLLCVVFFVGNMFSFGGNDGLTYFGPSSTFYFLILTLSGLCMTVKIFQHYEVLSSDNLCGRFLKLAGTWSLEIYFIHYFILPRNLTVIGSFFENNHNSIIEFALVLILAILVIISSVLIAKILSLSSILSWLLLGKKLELRKQIRND